MRLNVITKYTYTIETIVQAGKKNIKIASVPVTTNKVTRPSRLIKGVWDYLKNQPPPSSASTPCTNLSRSSSTSASS